MDAGAVSACLWAPRALLADGWHEHVQLDVTESGCWGAVSPGVATPPTGATLLAGPALPGLVDAHSHAFQRAFAGLAERREGAGDDFWSWRDRMYAVALRITPDVLRAVAAHLYVELLHGGYTEVCEFHYLHHREDGRPYDDPLAMSWSLADAAADAGIGITLLPVLYERAGFDAAALRDDQRRFATTAESVWSMWRDIAGSNRRAVRTGIAIHSLRAAAPESIRRLRELADGSHAPIHIHVAEQAQEVNECIAATGARPVEWLAREQLLDARWQLVHATHVTPAETDAVAASGAGVVLCPTTEANLGDGLTDVPRWLSSRVPLSLGSDSQVARAWHEELRQLEYGQRLARRERNVAAAPDAGWPSTADRLVSRVVAGSAPAAGFERWGFVAGARADLLVMDAHEPALVGAPPANALDALVFCAGARPWRDVMVAGRFVVTNRGHANAEAIAARFERAMHALWPRKSAATCSR